jgi:hypothetical protein
MWLRARTPQNLTYDVSAWRRQSRAFFSKLDLMVSAGSRNVPAVFKGRPILRFLGAKIAHFLHDYHHEAFPHCQLDAPDGTHKQLTKQQINHLIHRIKPPGRTAGALDIIKILKIGHKDFLGNQFIRGCQPGSKASPKCGGHDFVFFIPPPPFYSEDRCDFKAGLESCWYGRVVLLFKMKIDTGDDLPLECSCAMIEVLYDYRTRPPAWGSEVGLEGTKMVYLPAPDTWHSEGGANAPVVYIVPVNAILGRLALVPAGCHGTIPFSMRNL